MKVRPLRRAELPVDTMLLARFLIGKTLVHQTREGRMSGRIDVERTWSARRRVPGARTIEPAVAQHDALKVGSSEDGPLQRVHAARRDGVDWTHAAPKHRALVTAGTRHTPTPAPRTRGGAHRTHAAQHRAPVTTPPDTPPPSTARW